MTAVRLLSRTNVKLNGEGGAAGGQEVWHFSLPSGRGRTCPGASAKCEAACYDRRVEKFRPSMGRRREANLAEARRQSFVGHVLRELDRHRCQVVRVHGGGDFFSAAYARKWLLICRARPGVKFYFYTRSWRVAAVRPWLVRLARLPNVRAWWSCDAETGVPGRLPARTGLAWLMTEEGELPPTRKSLPAGVVFRVQKLRRKESLRVRGLRVCPPEDGKVRTKEVTCGTCALCWRGLNGDEATPPEEYAGARRLGLELVN